MKKVRLFVPKVQTNWIIVLFFLLLFPSQITGCQTNSYSPVSVNELEVIGTWEAHYGEGQVDKLIIHEHEFEQIYHDRMNDTPTFTVMGNPWRLDKTSDGPVRIYLKGAKYFRLGLTNADFRGTYDPFTHDFVQTSDELVLDILVDASGSLLLHHLFLDPDEGLKLFNNEVNLFRKVTN